MTGAIYVAGALDYETRKRVSIFILIKNIENPQHFFQSITELLIYGFS